MFKKEMSIKEFVSLPEIQTLIDEGMMTVNAIDEQEEIYDENIDEFVEEINKTGMLK
jgi:hypothetical protein|tara:strand:+ start:470 stop:640 length:171 start_codon:yes stop_codon:yes gene_type:complete